MLCYNDGGSCRCVAVTRGNRNQKGFSVNEEKNRVNEEKHRDGRDKALELARRGVRAHPNDDCDWNRLGHDRSVADALCVEMLQALDRKR